jgi:DNA-binding MarR family transcriptional regulator
VENVIEQLKNLGFSQYEAQAYITLLQHNPLNGYELAKYSGIPRPNIYTVLQKLEDQQAVVRLESSEGTRYMPVASDELVQNLRSHFQARLDAAKTTLSEIKTQVDKETIWNARGYSILIDHARAFIDHAEKELVLAIWPQEASLLVENLKLAEQRGVEITTLCMAGCPKPCENCRGNVHRYPVSEQESRWLVLVPDEREVLAGEIRPSEVPLSIHTHQTMLVNLAAWYIRHSIALAALVEDIGSQMEGLLSQRTRAILESLGPFDSQKGWLEHMRHLLKGEHSQS